MKRPWVKFFAGDFLNGVADLDAEQRGAYMTILCLIWDRGGPIPDDAGWLARRCGIGRRKWTILREQLVAMGKITIDGETITNRRAMRDLEVRGEVSEKRREAANERWSREPDFFEDEAPQNKDLANANASEPDPTTPFVATPPFQQEKQPEKPKLTPTFPARYLGENNGQSAENSDSGDASADASAFSLRARARPRDQILDNNNNDQLEPPPHAGAREGLPDDDLYGLTIACCDAAGMSARIASRPALLTQSIDVVKGWIASGVDIRATAIPVITAQLDRMNEPAHSLAKFAAAIDTHHAKAKRYVTRNGHELPPPATPVFEFSDESEAIATFRRKLAGTIGRANYSQFCKALSFRVIDWRDPGDKAALQIAPREGEASRLWEPGFVMERHGQAITTLAKTILGSQTVLQALKASSAKPSAPKP